MLNVYVELKIRVWDLMLCVCRSEDMCMGSDVMCM